VSLFSVSSSPYTQENTNKLFKTICCCFSFVNKWVVPGLIFIVMLDFDHLRRKLNKQSGPLVPEKQGEFINLNNLKRALQVV